MEFRLFLDKVKLALTKRVVKKKQKCYADWAAKGYVNEPLVTFIIQSHNKSLQVMHIVDKLRSYPKAEILVIDDGSELVHHDRLSRYLVRANEFLVRANDLYENVMYDKTIRMANGRYIALMQDDDDFKDLTWVDRAIHLFEQYPQMAILGGKDGMDFAIDKQQKKFEIVPYADGILADFRFVAHVDRAPMWINKALFMEKLKHIDFSFAPFQFDDIELCLRTWLEGYQVGWYKTEFSSLSAGGMRIWNNAFTAEQCQKNIQRLYELYADNGFVIHNRIELLKVEK
ncbi:glycosyltransferase [Parabacteroides distasonis]|nr:glycosyltransferase [Parabacteroides distasonis]